MAQINAGKKRLFVAALMQAHSNQPVRTFAIEFKHARYNEAVYACEVAKHFGTAHTEFIITEAVPLDAWLRGGLRDWAESLLAPEKLRSGGVFDPDAVLPVWRDHSSGKDNAGSQIWAVLVFQSWLEEAR